MSTENQSAEVQAGQDEGRPIEAPEYLKKNREALMEGLRQVGVEVAVVEYSGSNDSGDEFEIHFAPEGTQESAATQLVDYIVVTRSWMGGVQSESTEIREISAEEALEALANELIDREHGGYENNEGGRGEITLNVKEGWIQYEHFDYVVEEVRDTMRF